MNTKQLKKYIRSADKRERKLRRRREFENKLKYNKEILLMGLKYFESKGLSGISHVLDGDFIDNFVLIQTMLDK